MKVTIRINQDAKTKVTGELSYAAPDREALSLMELFELIEAEHQGFCGSVLDQGNVRETIIVLINGDNVHYLQGLKTLIEEEDEIYIIPAVAGG